MNLLDSIRMALAALSANKGRSFLTILGVVIGVGAVIAMISVGQGAQKDITRSVMDLGSNLIFVAPAGTVAGGRDLTMADADAISELPGVGKIAPEVNASLPVSYGGDSTSPTLSGTVAEFAEVRNAEVALGRFLTQADVDGSARVAVLGLKTADDLGTRDLLGERISINGVPFTVIGLLKPKGSAGPVNQDDTVIVPITTAFTRLIGEETLQGLSIQVTDAEQVRPLQDRIAELLRARHRRPPDAEDDFFMTSQEDILDTVSEITSILTALLGSIAGISLLVGGIGIMNIMLVSVTERTREIGIRKAIGARRRDILGQFLVESVVLSFCGGIVGIIFGWALSQAVSPLLGFPALITVFAVVLAFAVSASIGIFFGVYPAWKASRQDPIEALRYE